MVMPGGPDSSAPFAIAPDDLRQLAEHDARHRTFTGGAGPLTALDTGGDGERGTVLMVAGYTGSKEDFAPLLRPLCAAGHRVVALDQRGQFESPGPDDPARYTVAELAADLVAVGRELRIGSDRPVHLLGHSFGGLVSRAAVLADRTVFASLTLLGSGPSRLVGPRAELLDHLSPLLDAGGVPLVQQTLEHLAMTDPKAQEVPAPTRAFLDRRFLANSAAGLRGMADAMTTEPDRVAELAGSGVPVLVAHGVADDAWTPAAQADMARRLGARYEVIPGSIHSPAIENPARTLEVLQEFWAAVAARADGSRGASVSL
ncbi:alpha/beta fold hydrolase [Geodermatophilus sabuli]|uniref:Lysophospholipase, alpha-beta hydrolase superfamily n=1 Tax=Geodermatophilus sabuli TaxID=1564158 RepID=A0A285EHC7_9ACTN|nr:alpha/beta hydrolase [Geodermatophilus sabuli]MBB3086070.1 pimeloyl-ACP methyl ester carboxylesterase [Geodermatophilus sabuli]SNX98410.1 Lysophospholipase, alpha-beta hydrolase superfamily [Geodermatophilus sabuli]